MAQTALNEVDLGTHEYLRPHLSALLSDIYSRGVLGENKSQGDSSFVLKTISVRRDGASVRIPVVFKIGFVPEISSLISNRYSC